LEDVYLRLTAEAAGVAGANGRPISEEVA